jgi:hypothetical protein
LTDSSDHAADSAGRLTDSPLREIGQQLERLGDWYLDQLQAGESPQRIQIVAAYRQLAEQIQRRLELIDVLFDSDSIV